jgi:hypothetical protein
MHFLCKELQLFDARSDHLMTSSTKFQAGLPAPEQLATFAIAAVSRFNKRPVLPCFPGKTGRSQITNLP